MYKPTIWQDHVEGVQEGTDMNAKNFNNMEAGVMEAAALAAFNAENSRHSKDKIAQSADYIVEQGAKDGWTYRKWASGIAECWCIESSSRQSSKSSTLCICDKRLPFDFVNRFPVMSCTGAQNNDTEYTGYVTHSLCTQTYVSAFMQCRLEVNSDNYCWFYFEAKGRWKQQEGD